MFFAGVLLVLRHLHVWRIQTDASKDAKHRRFLKSQMRRRTLTSSAIAVLGLDMAALYWIPREPMLFTIIVCFAFLLIFLIFVMASIDFLAVSHAVRLEQSRSDKATQELVREYRRMKNMTKGNNDSD